MFLLLEKKDNKKSNAQLVHEKKTLSERNKKRDNTVNRAIKCSENVYSLFPTHKVSVLLFLFSVVYLSDKKKCLE